MSADTSLYTFEAGNLPPDTFAVLGFEAVERISHPTTLRVAAISRTMGLEHEELVAQAATFRVHLQGANEFHGWITEFSEEPFADGISRYEVHLESRVGLAAQGTHCRVFLGKTAPEILSAVLEEIGYDAKHVRQNFVRTYTAIPMHVQYNESDLAFLARTAQAAGIFMVESVENGDIALLLGDDNGAFPLAPLPKDLEYRPGAGLVEFELDAIFQLRRTNRMHTGPFRVSAYDFEQPGTISRGAAEGPGHSESRRFETSLRTPSETTEHARIQREAAVALRDQILAVTHTPLLRAGTKFSISRAHGAGFGGDYLATEVRHEGSQEGSILGNGTDSHYTNHLVAQPANLPFRPALAAPRPKVSGILIAKVDGPDGEYAPVDEQGRYHARFPFDEGNAAAGAATSPVRLAQPNAGPGWGLHSPLHKGTDMILAFEDGDLDRPIALGALPNPSRNTPVTSGNRSESVWKSATGNILVLDDLEGKTKVFLASSKGRSLLLDDTPETAGALLRTPDARKLHLDDHGKLVELSIGDGKHFLRISEQSDGKALAVLSTGSGHTIQLDDENGVLALQSAKGHKLRIDDAGEILTFSDADGKHVLQIDVGGSKIVLSTEGDLELNAKGALSVQAKSISLQAKSGAVDIKAARDINTQGANINLKADQKLAVQSGMDAGIKAGMNLKLEGSVNVESKAGMANKMTGTMTNVESSAINTIKGAMVMIN